MARQGMKKLALVGANLRTQGNAPYDDQNFEIWTLNEAPTTAPAIRRYDVVFQLHPRWDWERTNNLADPNHALYLKGASGPCVFCAASGKVTLRDRAGDRLASCPRCNGTGLYDVPAHRAGKLIVMQDQNADVPGCVKYPLDRVMARLAPGRQPYFTSTFAHMLAFAIFVGFTEIKIFGFGMESNTEYAHQRPCAEYWVGYGRALGLSIEAPGAQILRGEHYAFGATSQGERTRLELRRAHLQTQLHEAELVARQAEGALDALAPFRSLIDVSPAYDLRTDDHFRKKNFVSFLRGCLKEIETAIALHDAYYADGAARPGDTNELIGLTYQLS
jgi:hypothetical protein